MSNTAIVNIKTDPNTKKQLKKFADKLGLPMSALLNAQIKQMLRAGRVELSTNFVPTPYLKTLIDEAETDYAAGRHIRGPFETAEEMISSLEGADKDA